MFKKGYKPTEEHRRRMSEAARGKKKPWISIRLKGTKNPKHSLWLKQHKVIPPSQKGSTFNQGCHNPMFGKRGEQSPAWKGGLTNLRMLIRGCFNYRQWRADIFTRDNYTCQLCGTHQGELNVDHYPKGFAQIIHDNSISSLEAALRCEELWNINNGRTLCIECHMKTETYFKNYTKH